MTGRGGLASGSRRGTPASLGYRMPAEWEEHDGTWLSWPKDPDTFPPSVLGAVEKTFSRVIEALAEGEEVRVIIDDEASEARVKSKLSGIRAVRRENVTFLKLKTVDVWVRDYAPIYVRRGPGSEFSRGHAESERRGALALTKWIFNSWGDKYNDLRPDNEAGMRIANSTGLNVFEPEIVLEGGSIDVNGEGTLMTTEQCLLNPNRNPGLDRERLEAILMDNLGATNVLWLGSGIKGDDTDGHVDDIARFVAPSVVAVAGEDNPSDPNHLPLEEDLKRLRMAVDQDGAPFEILTVPMPAPVSIPEGRLPASHLNFYIGNSAVLVPTFDSPTDSRALNALRGYFPHRETVGIDCRALVYGLGTLHCVTQQIPAGAA